MFAWTVIRLVETSGHMLIGQQTTNSHSMLQYVMTRNATEITCFDMHMLNCSDVPTDHSDLF